MPVEYYRTTDPVENFSLRVVVREISRPKRHFSQQEPVRPPFQFDKVVRWQQKLYSPGEIADYVVNKNNTRGTASQLETRSFLSRLERDGLNVQALLVDPMIYTYIDRDRSEQNEVVSSGLNRDVSANASRNAGCKTMVVCLATEIDMRLLLGERCGDYRRHHCEHILCEVKVHQDGLVEVSPGLSKALAEPLQTLPTDLGVQYAFSYAHGAQSNVHALNLFLDDHTVKAAQRDGFAMSSCRLKCQSGLEFEYVVYNHKDVRNPFIAENYLTRAKIIDSLRSHENLFSSKNWKQDLPALRGPNHPGATEADKGEVLSFCVDISTARGFDADKLFVVYSVEFSDRFSLRSGNLTDGVANDTSEADSPVDGPRGRLCGSTHVARSNPRLPLRLGESSFLAKHDSWLVGTAYFLLSAAAVVLGLSVLFWVVLALGVLFVCRTYNTYAPPTLTVLPGASPAPAKRPNARPARFANYCRAGGGARPSSGAGPEGLHDEVVVLNHLLSFSLDAFPAPPATTAAAACRGVRLQLQVYRFDGDVAQCVGYGEMSLPLKAGGFAQDVDTLFPTAALAQRLHSCFLGADQRFQRPSYPHDARSDGGNRLGVLTCSSGRLAVRGHVIRTRPVSPGEDVPAAPAATSQTGGLAARREKALETKRTVEEILSSFRASSAASAGEGGEGGGAGGDRATAAAKRGASLRQSKQTAVQRALRPKGVAGAGPAAGPRPSVQEILQSLSQSRPQTGGSAPSAERAAAVLAKARAKAVASKGDAPRQREAAALEMSSLGASHAAAEGEDAAEQADEQSALLGGR